MTPDLQLWLGDCLTEMDRIPDGSIDMIAADLPYGVTACKWDSVIPFAPLWAQYKRVIKPRGAIVLTASQPFTSALVMSNPGWFRHRWVWIRGKRKAGFLDANKRPLRTFEDVLTFGAGRVHYYPQMVAGRKHTGTSGGQNNVYGKSDAKRPSRLETNHFPVDVINIDPDDSRRRVHPTQKPVALFEYLIRTYTNEGETVLDNTMGSGTTLIACLNTNRHGIGIEKDAEIYAVARKRVDAALAARAEQLIPA